MKRTLLVALVLGSVVPAALLLSRTAEAAACSGTTGVTVVVQFPDGHTEIGCAPGDPGTGLEALESAGFPYTFVQGQPGAVCTIDGAPARDCWGDKYWAYFHGSGSGWTYSGVGAGSYDPKPGSREGWRFGDGKCLPQESQTACDQRLNPKPTPVNTPKPSPSATRSPTTPKPAPSSTAGSAVAAPGASAGSTPSGSATPGATASGTATPSANATPTAGGSTTPSEVDALAGPAAAEVADSTEPTSGGVSWVWGVGLLVVLLAVGGAMAYRRRT